MQICNNAIAAQRSFELSLMKLSGYIRKSSARPASLLTRKMETEDFAKIACECRLTYGRVTNNSFSQLHIYFSNTLNFVNESGNREVIGEIPTGMKTNFWATFLTFRNLTCQKCSEMSINVQNHPKCPIKTKEHSSLNILLTSDCLKMSPNVPRCSQMSINVNWCLLKSEMS